MVNLPLTDEEIEAKVAELVDRKLREFIQAKVIKTNLRLRESQLAHGPTTAFGGAKALVNATLFPMLETQLERERQRLVTQAGTEDFLEGLSAFMQKKNPHFRGR